MEVSDQKKEFAARKRQVFTLKSSAPDGTK